MRQRRREKFGVTRIFTVGKGQRCGGRGNPEDASEARLEERGSGATRGIRCRQRGRHGDAGRPGTPSLAQPEGAEAGATRRGAPEARLEERGSGATRGIGRQQRRRMGDAGRLAKSIAGTAGRWGSQGNLAETPEARQAERGRGATREISTGIAKHGRGEATRGPIAGTAEGRTLRGNPGSAPPDEPKDAAEGQPEAARTAGPEDARRRGNSNPAHKAGWDER